MLPLIKESQGGTVINLMKTWLLLMLVLWAAMMTAKSRTLTRRNSQLTAWLNSSTGTAGERDLFIKGRPVRLYVPTSYDRQQPLPLVTVFHGRSQRYDRFFELAGLGAWAQRSRFILAVPSGVTVDGELQWTFEGERDLRFIDEVQDRVTHEYAIDRKRRYLFGFSNGAQFAFLYAARRPGKVAALVANSGPWKSWTSMPPREVPVLCVHGTRDWVFPISEAEASVRKLQESGRDVTLMTVQGGMHELFVGRLDEVWNWLQGHSL